MNITDDEATTLQNNDEATQLSNDVKPADNKPAGNEKKKGKSKIIDKINTKTAKRAGGFAAGGVLLGAAASIFKNANATPHLQLSEMPLEEHQEEISDGVLLADADSEEFAIPADYAADDDMTFGEAFSAAREELGPGSTFEWKGNVYATYTEEEWNEMSDDEKSDFFDGLDIPNPFSSSESEGSETQEIVEPATDTQTSESPSESNESEDQTAEPTTDEEGQSIIVEAELQTEEEVDVEDPYEDDGLEVVQVEAPHEDDSIQIIGVGHDADSGMNIAAVQIDGQEAFVVDVDGDMVFDEIVVDINNDGVIDQNEMFNIQDLNLTVDDFGGFQDPYGEDPLASNDDGPDYLADMLT